MTTVLCVGHAVQDYIFTVRDIPTTATKHQSSAFEVIGGGPAANAAVAISRLSGDARLAARIGDDPVGAAIIEELIADNVDCALMRRCPGAQSSLSAVMVDATGARMIVNHRDANLPASPEWLIDAFPAPCPTVLADVRWPEGAIAALGIAREAGALAILDGDHPFPTDNELLSLPTHIAFSRDGLTELTGISDLREALRAIRARTTSWLCVTDGENGVIMLDKEEFKTVPAFSVDSIDTLGAGDVWHGAFALSLSEGASEADAVVFANSAAALKVKRSGGRRGAPFRTEVDQFLQTHEKQEIPA